MASQEPSQLAPERVKNLARTLTDNQIAEKLNKDGLVSAKGSPFTKSIVSWIRYKYSVDK